MTEAAPGSGAQPGSPAATNGGAADGSSQAATDPFSGLDTGSREWVEKSGAKDVATLVKNARHSESLIGKSLVLPDDKAKPEDWDKVFNRLGRPEKADGYEFKLPEGVPKEMPYDADFASAFKPVAHQLGLTAKQAAGVHDFYVGKASAAHTEGAKALETRVTAATTALEKEWGASGSDGFKLKASLADRAITGLGIDKALEATGLFGPNKMVLDPTLAIALARVGEAMFKEGSMVTGSGAGGNAANNPFKDGPTKGNLTEQMKAIKADEPGARRLISAAGFKPEDFGLKAA